MGGKSGERNAHDELCLMKKILIILLEFFIF